MKQQPDILLFMSDQHGAEYTGYEGCPVDTPNLNELAQNGVSFSRMYTSCPLCVPARMSFLSGSLPTDIGILTNNDTLADTTPTFLHPLAAAGYETVLAGRMHFIGSDQRHGFVKRIAADITPVSWTRMSQKLKAERGPFEGCFAEFGALQVMGGGDSPVLHYDAYVIKQVLDYLKQPHDKPQFIVVGTYGPHFPYVAPPELYQKYKSRVKPPANFAARPEYMNEFLLDRCADATEEECLQATAAYYGMIELADRQLGQVRQAFREFTATREHTGIFAYTSDHGDMLGKLGCFGKNMFFESSVRIPFLVEGEGLPRDVVVKDNASIMDIGPTLCELAGSSFPAPDGKSLVPVIQNNEVDSERTIISQALVYKNPLKNDKKYAYAAMALKGNYKFVTYCGYEAQDMLFNIEEDPEEMNNLIHELPELADKLRTAALNGVNPRQVMRKQAERMRNAAWFSALEQQTVPDDSERWKDVPPSAREMPAFK